METIELQRGNSKVIDIETNTLNKFTDDRVGEVYSVIVRDIYEDKVNEEIKAIQEGKEVDLSF